MLIAACLFAYAGIAGLVAMWTAHTNEDCAAIMRKSPALNGAMWLPFLIAGSFAYGSLIIAGVYAAYEASGADKHRR